MKEVKKMKNVNVGIDLGTTHSAVAVFDKARGEVEILKNDLGRICTPSVVCIENGTILIGEEAKNEQAARNSNTAAFYKSMMADKDYHLYLDGNEYTPEDLSAIFLAELKKKIEEENDVKIGKAVITVPAYFKEEQRKATMRAGKRAGLDVVEIINEPTAAIIAYGLTGKGKRNVLVYDLGGGTFDVTIAEVNGSNVRVLATNGNHQLGGKNWDYEIVKELIDRFREEHGININEYPEEYKKLQVTAEDAKKRLTKAGVTTVTISCEGYSGRYDITRELFDSRTADNLNTTAMLIQQCFEEIGGGFGWHSLDEVVLVGGSTRMPQVREYVMREYGKPPVTKNIDVDTIVAAGAAMQVQLTNDGFLVLGGNSENITSPIQLGGAVGKNPSSTLVLPGNISDISGHALGMLAFNKANKVINSVIVPKNSKKNQPFGKDYTFNGDALSVYVLQGDAENPYDHEKILYKYIITGMKSGVTTRLTVNFLYNNNGMVDVTAQTADGQKLRSEQIEVTETIDEVIAALEKERKEALEAAKRAKALEVMFVIDVSGSMSGDRIQKAISAVREFVGELKFNGSTKVSILLFGDLCGYTCRAATTAAEVKRGIDSIYPTFDVGTYKWGTGATPLTLHGNDFTDRNANRVIVVLTDGEWGRKDAEIRAAQTIKANGTTIYAVGVADANKDFLDKLASKKGAKVELKDLGSTFKAIASSIATEA
jgi:molecular chaperone DnaK (HSP70)